LPAAVEKALAMYKVDGCDSAEAVPEALVQGSVPVGTAISDFRAQGPADAGSSSADASLQEDGQEVFYSAAVVDTTVNDLPVADLWAKAISNAQVLDRCAASLHKAAADSDGEQTSLLQRQEAETMIETVRIVQRLTSEGARQELEEFCRQDNQAQKGLTVAFGHSSDMLSFFAPEFLPWCFVELFPYGDCGEHVDLSLFADDDAYASRSPSKMQCTREAPLRGKAWCKVLLLRADLRRWRLHPEWIATAFSTMLQREQMYAINISVRQPAFRRDASELDGLRSEELLHTAEQLGQHACVRDALRSSGVPPRVKTLLTRMQLAQQNVRCTDAYRAGV
jgi:hypothetical protein